MKELKLTQGKTALVSGEDFDYLNQFNWQFTPRGYVKRSTSRKMGKKTTIFLHRELMGFPVGLYVDHIDGNPLNNQRDNLRLSTPSENLFNAKKWGVSRGIIYDSWYKPSNRKWRVRIQANGVRKHVGRFFSFAEALSARKEAEKLYFGRFAP